MDVGGDNNPFSPQQRRMIKKKKISPPVGSRLVLRRPVAWWMQLLPDPRVLLAGSRYRMERLSLEVAQSWHFISSGFLAHTHTHIQQREQQRQQQSSGSFLNIQAWWQSQCARSWLADWLSTHLGWALSVIFFFFFLLVRGGSRDWGRGMGDQHPPFPCYLSFSLCLFILHWKTKQLNS